MQRANESLRLLARLRCKSPEMIDKELIMHAMASGSDDGPGKKWLKVLEQGKVS